MSSHQNHQTSTLGFLHDHMHISTETFTLIEEDTCRTQNKGKEVILHEDNVSNGVTKKQDHNNKERLRRMRLHASYLTLGTLLPHHSSSSKKKWCAPSIMDRVIAYIPKLQNEVQELTLKKQNLLELEKPGPSIRAISVLELGGSGDEVVVQICTKKEKEDEFSNLLHVMEAQGLSILSTSTSQICQDQKMVCYNIHVKMNEKPCEGVDYITMLKNNIISSFS